jgi:hypothetical protein
MSPEQKGKVRVEMDLLDLVVAPFVGINPLDLIKREALRVQAEQTTDPAKKEALLARFRVLDNKIIDKLWGTGY